MPSPFPVESAGGFLVLDKPAGPTSHDCVARVRRAYGLRRVGHGGTLDPAVTGVLPIALGPATRLLPYLPGEKAYRGVVQLGLSTSTDDLEGELLARTSPPVLDLPALEKVLAGFRGVILQRPPAFSAVHVEGERAYARARRGEEVLPAVRPVTIHHLELVAWDPLGARLELDLRCSAGTYVRSLARDLGEALGCGGVLASLRRTAALGFSLAEAVTLDRLEADPPPPLLPVLRAVAHLPQRTLDAGELAGWRCGRAFRADAGLEPEQPVAVLAPDGNLAGIARVREGELLQPRLVFDAAG